jgi:hypothetical protein
MSSQSSPKLFDALHVRNVRAKDILCIIQYLANS